MAGDTIKKLLTREGILYPMPMVIGVISTVGGSGVTFISTNIASWCAQYGKNSVVLTEWGKDNIIEALYMREKSFNQIYPTTANYKQSNTVKSLLETPYGLCILPGTPECTVVNFAQSINILKDNYSLIVVDIGNQLSFGSKKIIEACDLIYLVAEPTNECMQSLVKHKGFITASNLEKIILIINNVSPQSYYHPRDIAQHLNKEAYIILPYEPKHVNKSVAKRQPLVYYSKGKCCSILRRIAEKVYTENIKCKSNIGTCVTQDNITSCACDCHSQFSDNKNRDFITGCLNRAALEKYLNSINTTYCVAFCDIDNFKFINDTYGHAAGDEILQSFGVFLKNHKRDSDHIFRYGGDEFILVLPNTNLDGAKVYMDRLSLSWSQKKFPIINNRSVTLSGGVAQYGLHGKTPKEVLKAADEAMYLVKRSGRGRIEMARVHASYSINIDTNIKQTEITTATERLIGIWGDGTKNILKLFDKPGRKTVIVINADPDNQRIAFQAGVDMGLLWKHDWRLGLNAEPFRVNSKAYLYSIDYNKNDIESRDLWALCNLIKKHLKHKKERIVVNMGFNKELKNILHKLNGVIVGGDFY